MQNKTEKVLAELNGAGAMNHVVWLRPLKTLKGVSCLVTKQVTAVVAAGKDYAKLASNDGAETGPLPWGEWVRVHYVIGHTPKNGDYTEYIRLYPPTEAQLETMPGFRMQAEYFVNGESSGLETVRPLCRASEFAKEGDESPKCICVKVESIVEVGGVKV